MVRFGHFSPDAPNIDVLVEGELVSENLGFEEVTEFFEMNDGSYMIEIRPHGETPTVLEGSIDLLDEVGHTVIVSGLIEKEEISLTVIDDVIV